MSISMSMSSKNWRALRTDSLTSATVSPPTHTISSTSLWCSGCSASCCCGCGGCTGRCDGGVGGGGIYGGLRANDTATRVHRTSSRPVMDFIVIYVLSKTDALRWETQLLLFCGLLMCIGLYTITLQRILFYFCASNLFHGICVNAFYDGT